MSDIDIAVPPARQLPLKPYPFAEGGVNENAAIRNIRMVKPHCPIDSAPEIRQKDGSLKPNPRYTGEQNCQQLYRLNAQGRWDVQKCIDLGHDPFYIHIRKTLVDDVVGDDGVVSEQRVKVIQEKRINIVLVSDNSRHSSGNDVNYEIARGSQFLEGFACHCSLFPEEHEHEVPCEFRHCTKPKTIKTRWGQYCSERHARLVAADKQEVLLIVPSGDPMAEDKATREREAQLNSLPIDARPI